MFFVLWDIKHRHSYERNLDDFNKKASMLLAARLKLPTQLDTYLSFQFRIATPVTFVSIRVNKQQCVMTNPHSFNNNPW